MYKFHIMAFTAGFFLDLLLGDPHWLPHPVVFIGKLISFFEKLFLGKKNSERFNKLSKTQKRIAGFFTVLLVCVIVLLIVVVILICAYKVNRIAGCLLESIMTYQILATKCLKVESMKVYKKLETGTLEEARYAVSMIVGRDTENLTDEEVTKAAVETVAENTSDGIIAPMIYLAIGGPFLGFLYKAINTMDSMIAYKNERYIDYGFFAAKTDDIVNFLPARISAWLMIYSSVFLGKDYSFKNGVRIFERDRYNHESPNSAQTESACAGILGIRLAGPASYGGVIENKLYIGDALRSIEHNDIKRANKLLYSTAFLCYFFCMIFLLIGVI